MAASVGLKFKDCIGSGHILFKEYLVAGTAATALNEFRMFPQENTCGLDIWDLTLSEAQQVSSSNRPAAPNAAALRNSPPMLS